MQTLFNLEEHSILVRLESRYHNLAVHSSSINFEENSILVTLESRYHNLTVHSSINLKDHSIAYSNLVNKRKMSLVSVQ